jgi:hypothetical protein
MNQQNFFLNDNMDAFEILENSINILNKKTYNSYFKNLYFRDIDEKKYSKILDELNYAQKSGKIELTKKQINEGLKTIKKTEKKNNLSKSTKKTEKKNNLSKIYKKKTEKKNNLSKSTKKTEKNDDKLNFDNFPGLIINSSPNSNIIINQNENDNEQLPNLEFDNLYKMADEEYNNYLNEEIIYTKSAIISLMYKKDVIKQRLYNRELVISVKGSRKDVEELWNAKYLTEVHNLDTDTYNAYADAKVFGAGAGIPVTGGVSMSSIGMKNIKSYKLSGEECYKWDTNRGRCVFDYLINTYGDTKGLKKIMNFENLKNEFGEESLNLGVTISQIENLCKKYNISYYALDSFEKNIEMYNAPNPKYKSLLFRLINSHIYPIEEENKRKQIIRKNAPGLKIKDIGVEINKGVQKEIYEVIYNYDENIFGNDYAIRVINQLNTIPFPFTSQNIYVSDGVIQKMIIDGKLYLTEMPNEHILKYYNDNNLNYQGETIHMLLSQFWQEVYGHDIYNTPELVSTYNNTVYEILQMNGVKDRVHFGKILDVPENIIDMLKNGNALSCDIEKCYSSLLINPYDDFIRLDICNEVEIFSDDSYYKNNKNLDFGLYIVETDDLTILHQSNIYSNKILDYAKENNVKFKILYQIKANKFNNRDFFKSIINHITSKTKDIELIKLLINIITGCLGKTESKHMNVALNNNLDEIFNSHIMKNIDSSDGLYFKKLPDSELYLYGSVHKKLFTSSCIPMYIQILDWSNIKLHKMRMEMGGICVWRKTDAVLCINTTKNMTEMNKDPENIFKTWGSFRNEKIEEIEYRTFSTMMRTDRHVYFPNIKINDWIYYKNINSSSQYVEIIEIAKNKGGLLISGRAGTGKSYIIEQGIKENLLPSECETRLAFTNKAARNINGTTIHKALSINANDATNSKTLIKYISDKNIIIVDEIGMIKKELWDKLLLIKRTKPDIIFILLGDYRQCLPIETDGIDRDYFKSSVLKCLVNNNFVELTKMQRYDLDLWNFLENYYEHNIFDSSKIKTQKELINSQIENSKMICYFNSTRDIINNKCMEIMKNGRNHFYLPYERINEDDKRAPMYIYVGLPVRCIMNNSKYDIINSDEFNICDWDENTISIISEFGKILEIEIDLFHKFFVCNYICTTHCLQGSTIDTQLLIFDWYPSNKYNNCLKNNKHVGYTALSRVKSLNQIIIIN